MEIDHKARAWILLEILKRAQGDLANPDAGQRSNARRVIDDYWHASVATVDPLRALVNALETARHFQRPANSTTNESLLAKAAPDERREEVEREALIGVAMLEFPPTSIPKRELLWSAIQGWTQKNTRKRWPAVYALARSIGIDKKPETLKREINRILGRP